MIENFQQSHFRRRECFFVRATWPSPLAFLLDGNFPQHSGVDFFIPRESGRHVRRDAVVLHRLGETRTMVSLDR